MNRITAYVFRQSFGLTLFITAALTSAAWLIQSLKLVELVVDRGVGIDLFIELLAFSLPPLVQLVLPIGCFIGVLFTYNKLIQDSELVVMRACGVSQWGLARPAMALGTVGMVMMTLISLYILPLSKNSFKDLQFSIRNEFTFNLVQEGSFNKLSERLTVYVRNRNIVGDLFGLLIEDTRDQNNPATYTAERGLISNVDGKPKVLMVNGTKGTWDPVKKQLSMLQFDSYSLDLQQFKDVPDARILQPDERFLDDLFNPQGLDDNPIFRHRLLAEAHERLTSPLFLIGFVFIALGAILTGELNRRGQTRRLLYAIGLAVIFQLSYFGATNLANRQYLTIPLLYVVSLLPSLIGIYLLSRRYGRNRMMNQAIRGQW